MLALVPLSPLRATAMSYRCLVLRSSHSCQLRMDHWRAAPSHSNKDRRGACDGVFAAPELLDKILTCGSNGVLRNQTWPISKHLMDAWSTLGVPQSFLAGRQLCKASVRGRIDQRLRDCRPLLQPAKPILQFPRDEENLSGRADDTAQCLDNRVSQCKTRAQNTLQNKQRRRDAL